MLFNNVLMYFLKNNFSCLLFRFKKYCIIIKFLRVKKKVQINYKKFKRSFINFFFRYMYVVTNFIKIGKPKNVKPNLVMNTLKQFKPREIKQYN